MVRGAGPASAPSSMKTPAPSSSPIRSPLARLAALVAVLAWLGTMLVVCAVKFRSYLYTDFDLAIFAQSLLGAVHGRWFSSIRGLYWLGDHSSLLLLALAPLALVWHSALLLPCVQACALALGAWPLFVHARRRFGDERVAAAFAAAWVLQPSLGYLALFEFHPETLATPLLLGAAVALAAGRSRTAICCAAVAALAREDIALPIAVMGAVHLLRGSRTRGTGFALLGVAAGSLALSFLVLRPLLAHGEANYVTMYARWGRGPAEIAMHLLRDPGAALASFWSTPGDRGDTLVKLEYWLHTFGPVLGASLLAPLSLLPALPVFAEHFLSSRVEQHTIVYQYTALTLPFVALAAVDGIAALARWRPALARGTTAALLAAAAASQWAFGPFAPAPLWRGHDPTEHNWPDGRERALAHWRDTFQDRLPEGGAVVADFRSLAPLATRDSLHSLHHIATGHYTFSSLEYPAPLHPVAMICDLAALAAEGQIHERGLARLRWFVARSGLRVVDSAGDLLLLEPTDTDTLAWLEPATDAAPRIARFDGTLDLLEAHTLAAEATAGGVLPIATSWRRVGPLAGAPMVQWSVTGPDGETHDEEPRRLGYGLSDVSSWPANHAFEERYRWVVPVDLAPGTYTLHLTVWRHGSLADTPAVADDDGVRAAEGMIEVGSFRVTP
jgi:uncharacterized membrane protein